MAKAQTAARLTNVGINGLCALQNAAIFKLRSKRSKAGSIYIQEIKQ